MFGHYVSVFIFFHLKGEANFRKIVFAKKIFVFFECRRFLFVTYSENKILIIAEVLVSFPSIL